MIVAVPLVRVMEMALHKIVSVATVRNSFVPAAGAVRMLPVMRSAGMARSASRRIRAAFHHHMFIHMSGVRVMKMPVVQIINVAFVFDRGVAAAWTVRM